VGKPEGVAAEKLNDQQRTVLDKLIQAYVGRLPADVAAAELDRIRESGTGNVHFAFAGGTEPGQPHTYRLHGPTFVAEFLNVQDDSAKNPANQATPIFMAHGFQDPVVPYPLGDDSRQLLLAAGYSVEWHSYPMPHSLCEPEVSDIRAFLKRVAAA
jgi:hypothetical protein